MEPMLRWRTLPRLSWLLVVLAALFHFSSGNEVLSYDMTWMNLEGIMLSEISQPKGQTLYGPTYMSTVVKSIETNSGMVVTRAKGKGKGWWCLRGTEFQICKRKHSRDLFDNNVTLLLNTTELHTPQEGLNGISRVTKTVQGTATLSCDYNISVDELSRVRIYWQKENEMVLSIISGNVQVWSQYKNRTLSDITNNLSLVILALRLSDRGTYTCVVQKTVKGSFIVKHLTSVMLSIKADFPAPNITDVEHPSSDLRRIICSSSGGFPKPYLSWLENGEEVKAVNTTVNQDLKTELYTVYSYLDFNVTSNHSFVCSIKYGDSSVSQIFNWEKLKEDPPEKAHWIFILVILVCVLIFVTVMIYCICRSRHRVC